MAEQQEFPVNAILTEYSAKIRDIEEKQKLLKDRVMLIGQNLIETKEKYSESFNDIIKDLEIMKSDITRMKSIIKQLSDSYSEFARKEELNILIKQSKMFQPLKLATIEDVERIVEEKLKNNE